jgi:putative ABC transport system permease protein
MKKLLMVLRVGINALTVHKMRSFLTMLGVVIGIAAVIALVGVGKGAQAQVVSQFQSLGSNLLVISSQQSFGFNPTGLQTKTRQLNIADVE